MQFLMGYQVFTERVAMRRGLYVFFQHAILFSVTTYTQKGFSVFKEQDYINLLLEYISKIQQDATDAGIYLLQNYSTCFGCL